MIIKLQNKNYGRKKSEGTITHKMRHNTLSGTPLFLSAPKTICYSKQGQLGSNQVPTRQKLGRT